MQIDKELVTSKYMELDINIDEITDLQFEVLTRKIHNLGKDRFSNLEDYDLRYLFDLVTICIVPNDVRHIMLKSIERYRNLPPFVFEKHEQHFENVSDEQLTELKTKYLDALSANQLAELDASDAMFNWASLVKMLYEYEVAEITLPMIRGRYDLTMQILEPF